MARPSEYTEAKANIICNLLGDGISLRKICAADDMPDKATVFRWIIAHDKFRDQYARARETQADTMADEILEIADDGKRDTYIDENGNERTDQDVIARSRLRVDARKWLASKMAPKKYGDKVQQEITGKDGAPLLTGIEVTYVSPKG